MAILTVLMDPILPVFAILAFGFAMGRAGRVAQADARVLNRCAMAILVPILIFDLVANAPVRDFSPLPMLVFAAVEWVIFAAVFVLCRRGLKLGQGEAVILAFGAVFANNAFYGLPIALLLHGEGGVLPMTMVVALDSIVTFGGIIMVLQVIERGSVRPRVLLAILFRSPVLLAILAGVAVALAGVALPGPVQTFLGFNGKAAAPVALFALGVVLSGTRFVPDRAVVVVSLVKLVVFPASLWLALSPVAGEGEAVRQFVFASAGPTGTMAFSLALLHDIDSDRVAQIMVWTSVLSLLTLAVLA